LILPNTIDANSSWRSWTRYLVRKMEGIAIWTILSIVTRLYDTVNVQHKIYIIRFLQQWT
jgi:hypothetical protein